MSGNDARRGDVNEGIQGNVHAEVVAVGRQARATKYAGAVPIEDMRQAIAQLRAAIGGIGLPPPALKVLDNDLTGLDAAAQSDRPDRQKTEAHLTGIADKLKMVGIVLADVAALAEPARKIAELVRIPLSFLTG